MTFARLRPIVAVLLGVAAFTVATTVAARADGDPGSDVLLAQNLFAGYGTGIGTAEQEQLGKLLDARARRGPRSGSRSSPMPTTSAPTRRCGKAPGYAAFLGDELSLTYRGPLLVVMPNAVGFYWAAKLKAVQHIADSLSGIVPGSSAPPELIAATRIAVHRVEAAAPASGPTPANSNAASASPTSPSNASSLNAPAALEIRGGGPNQTLLAFAVLALVAVVVLMARPLVRRQPWRPTYALMSAPLALVAVVLVVLSQNGSTPVVQAGTLQTNPNLDPGTVPNPVRVCLASR